MDSLTDKFFELLRLAIGTSAEVPSLTFADIKSIYEIAKKQSLLGVLFNALDKSGFKPTDVEQHKAEFEDLLMQWMGDKVKIERRNEKLNKDVVEVTDWLNKEGFESCLLKGQGNALLYPNPSLRTCGDIDLWVRPKVSNGFENDIKTIISFVRKNAQSKCRAIYHHVDGLEWNSTEVEVHYRPHFMQDFTYNARLQKYFLDNADKQFRHYVPINIKEVAVPTPSFNIVFQISHIYQHLFKEGIGLRQVLDYYYVLKSYAELHNKDGINWNKVLTYLGLKNITSAIMWILIRKFGMNPDWAIVESDEKRGRFVLNEILQGGNFGKYDERNARFGHSKIGKNVQRICRDARLVRYFPSEALIEPFFRIWHAWWRYRHDTF